MAELTLKQDQVAGFDDGTATALYILKQYALCERDDLNDAMRILNWLEDRHPWLEAMCDEMRISFAVPLSKGALRKALRVRAFSKIIGQLSSGPYYPTQATGASSAAA